MTHGAHGTILDVGRRTRAVPPALRRALDFRDGGCRFPGCGAAVGGHFADAHHVQHWGDGGATKLDNLVLLCRFHHRAVHEGGFRVEIGADGALAFHRPDGRELLPVPEASLVPDDAAAAFQRKHEAVGVEPGPWTPTPGWTGEPLDLDFAILTMWRPRMG